MGTNAGKGAIETTTLECINLALVALPPMIGPSTLISSAQPVETAARRFLRFGRVLSQ